MGDALCDVRAAQINGHSLWNTQQVKWRRGGVCASASKWAIQSSAHLDGVLPKEEELVRAVKTSVSLVCSDHVVSHIPRDEGKEISRAQTLHMRE